MRCTDFLERLERRGLRCLLAGTETFGVVAGLDLEGRLFLVYDGQVISRVNPGALDRPLRWDGYQLPGGDGLWPAPEGSTLGFEYATGAWRVPPGLVAARFYGQEQADGVLALRAEIDLVNRRGIGLPLAVERQVQARLAGKRFMVRVRDRFEYLGDRELASHEALLAPWSLSQFPCRPGCHVFLPLDPAVPAEQAVWDLYDASPEQRERTPEGLRLLTEGTQRYQVGISPEVPWIEFRDPQSGLAVRRETRPPPEGASWLDIADAPPDQPPRARATRYSVYADASGFMEAETVGTYPGKLTPGTQLELTTDTLVQPYPT